MAEADAGACVPKVAHRCFWVTTSLETATFLLRENIGEENHGRVASVFAYQRIRLCPRMGRV